MADELIKKISAFVQCVGDLIIEMREDRKASVGSRCHADLATKTDTERLERLIIMTQQELAAGLRAIQTQVGKVAKEQSDRFDSLTKTIAELRAIIDAGGTIGPEVTDALASVQTALQALDDVIPDAPPTT